jgi:hypothetical protein
MAGRPTKLTPEIRQRIIKALKGSVPLTTAVSLPALITRHFAGGGSAAKQQLAGNFTNLQ